jgi:hypothetical protein
MAAGAVGPVVKLGLGLLEVVTAALKEWATEI